MSAIDLGARPRAAWLLSGRPRVAVFVVLSAALLVTGGTPALDARQGTRATLTNALNIPLWDEGKVPLALGTAPLDKPFLTVVLPPENRRNGASVIVAPGGANIMLMYGGEGLDIAERYNDWGVTSFILTYRLSPKYRDDARVMDGKRAIQMVRAHAAEWKLDPAKIGYIGFSAGSNMARPMTASAGPGDPQAADPVERVSSRPDYLALVYGPGNATPGEALKSFPPTFLVSAAGDMGPSMGNAQLFMDLTRAGAVAEIHVYQKGRHGFGAGNGSPEFEGWMPALAHFLRQGGFLPPVPPAVRPVPTAPVKR